MRVNIHLPYFKLGDRMTDSRMNDQSLSSQIVEGSIVLEGEGYRADREERVHQHILQH